MLTGQPAGRAVAVALLNPWPDGDGRWGQPAAVAEAESRPAQDRQALPLAECSATVGRDHPLNPGR